MSNKVIITKSKINAIVKAIHDSNKETESYTLDQMPNIIRNLFNNNSNNSLSNNIVSAYRLNIACFESPETIISTFELK